MRAEDVSEAQQPSQATQESHAVTSEKGNVEPSCTPDTQTTAFVSEQQTIQVNSDQQSIYPIEGVQMENYVHSAEDNANQQGDEILDKAQEQAPA